MFDGVRIGGGIDNQFGMGRLGLAIGSLFVIDVTVSITLFMTKRKSKQNLSV